MTSNKGKMYGLRGKRKVDSSTCRETFFHSVEQNKKTLKNLEGVRGRKHQNAANTRDIISLSVKILYSSNCEEKQNAHKQRTYTPQTRAPVRYASMQVTKQPPATFANQQHDKNHGFEVSVYTGSSGSGRLLLQTDVVYADDLKPVSETTEKSKEPLLQILEKQDFNEGHAKIYCRINDLSQNHKGRYFRILLTCMHLEGPGAAKLIAKTYTRPIKVISRERKEAKCKRACPASSIFCKSNRYSSPKTVSSWSAYLDEVAASRRQERAQHATSLNPSTKRTCHILRHKRSRSSHTQTGNETANNHKHLWSSNRLQLLSNLCAQAKQVFNPVRRHLRQGLDNHRYTVAVRSHQFKCMLLKMPRQLRATFYALYKVAKNKVASKGSDQFPQAQEAYEQTTRLLREAFWRNVVATGCGNNFADMDTAAMGATPRQRALAMFDKMSLKILKLAIQENASCHARALAE